MMFSTDAKRNCSYYMCYADSRNILFDWMRDIYYIDDLVQERRNSIT